MKKEIIWPTNYIEPGKKKKKQKKKTEGTNEKNKTKTCSHFLIFEMRYTWGILGSDC
jgi:hypothetical protein